MNSAQSIEEVVMTRIRRLDITKPECLSQVRRLREDLTVVRMSEDKVHDINNLLRSKMTEIAGSDDHSIDFVYHELEGALVALHSQIDGYQASDDNRKSLPNAAVVATTAASASSKSVH